jgi:hypothetical protein
MVHVNIIDSKIYFSLKQKSIMNEVKRVTEKQAIAIINAIVGSPIFRIVWLTIPQLNKSDRQTGESANYATGEISKLTELSCKIGTEYERMVLNRLEKEGKSSDEYKKGANRLPMKPIAKNGILGWVTKNIYEVNRRINPETGKMKNFKDIVGTKEELHIKVFPISNVTPIVNYIYGKDLIKKNEIGDILPVTKKAENQGTDKEIIIRKPKFENILSFTIDQTQYEIVR